jgi:tripartite-type tricarboxylate transporter receptor subunit TctC
MAKIRKAVLFAILLAPAVAHAQSVEEFYRGKTINMIIGYPVAGANDFFARTVARHIGKYIPGQPRVVPRNMPGGGSFVAANHLFNVAPRDGTVLGLLAATIPLEQALGAPNVKFKAGEFNWIGRMAPGTNVTFVWSSSPVKTIEDAMTTQVILGSTGRSATPTVYPSVLNNVLGTKFKMVMGYEGSTAAMLAMERGEVEGHSTSWDGLRAFRGNWVRDGRIRILVQYAVRRHPDLPDVRTSVELGRNEEETQILRVVAHATEVGKMVLSTPGVPADRVAALRRAFDAMVGDPEYIADMKAQGLELTPMGGQELQQFVEEIGRVPPAILDKVKAIYPLN